MSGKKAKNIALIIPTLSGGGAERIAANLSIYLSDRFNVYIIIYKKTENPYPYQGEILELNLPFVFYYLTSLIRVLLRHHKLKRIKEKYDIDVTISFLAGPNIANILSRGKGKTVVSVRDFKSEQKGYLSKIINVLIKLLYNKSDTIITVSQGVSEDLSSKYRISKNKIETIYNPLSISSICKRKEERIEDAWQTIFENPMIITAGRLVPVKCQWSLIRAFFNLKEKRKNLQLAILGEGPLKDSLKALTENYGIQESVHFLGFRENPYQFLNRSLVFVLPSLSEGFGNVIVEALACSIPVISTDCPAGPREILTGKSTFDYTLTDIEYARYGVLVPRFDAVFRGAKEPLTHQEILLSRAMERLITEEGVRVSYIQRALQRAMDFDTGKIVPQWIETIQRVSR